MEISVKTFALIGSVLLSGLSAGLFYAWSVSVIPGTRKVIDPTYLETMQSINRGILNPAFFAIFFGSIIFLVLASIYAFNINQTAFWLFVAASATYLIGTVGVTGLGNVPLNNKLEALNLSEMSAEEWATFRKDYETNWNRLHTIRTVFAVLAFLLSTVALFISSNK